MYNIIEIIKLMRATYNLVFIKNFQSILVKHHMTSLTVGAR